MSFLTYSYFRTNQCGIAFRILMKNTKIYIGTYFTKTEQIYTAFISVIVDHICYIYIHIYFQLNLL